MNVTTNRIIRGDALQELRGLPSEFAQVVIADPPYGQVLPDEWDNQWDGLKDYLDWNLEWVSQSMRVLQDDGLLFICGQLGKREHAFIHLSSELCRRFQFHDRIIWDRVVGYNERRDSATPAYEEILVLRKSNCVKFHKGAVRTPYDAATIARYSRDKRYMLQFTTRTSFLTNRKPSTVKGNVNTTYGDTTNAGSSRLKDQPAGERPRERLVEHGPAALSAAELIAILVRTGLRGTNAVDIGRQLVQRFGSLGAMARASVDDLQCIRGIGRDKAVTLVAAFTLASKMAEELQRDSPVLDNPQAVAELLREQNRTKNVETFQILMLNVRRKLIRVEQVSQGLLDTILVHPREVFQSAIAARAAAIVLVHNLCVAAHKLCMTITALAAVTTASRNTSRGCTKIVSIVPMETSWWPLIFLRVFKSRTARHSQSGLKCEWVAMCNRQ